ncbi:hypothetical protein ACN28E_47370 [Archangium lansingense]|uniref:hypothetical protein n=1 Tax=Archangium lansingense TaxID=2995310 RepID=UPI003B7DE535
MSERHIEMFWRCSSCNHRNLGRHQVCQSCKNPKDGSEQYEMPEDTASAVTVTDEALLRMATAGPNWRCAYCESDQRAFDGSCKSCGASAVEGSSTEDEAPPVPSTPPASGKGKDTSAKPGCGFGTYLVMIVVVFGCCCPMWMAEQKKSGQPQAQTAEQPKPGPEWTRALQVKELAWEHSVLVERYHLVENEGFEEDRPEGALQVKSLGSRHHHDEQVLNGYNTVYYTEQVQKGYTTETYRDREACGQDCSTTPKKCTESCKSNKNGFATCKTTCTGGDKSCTTRYCSVTKTRKVPRYVDERRSRKEPRYRSVPHKATWYAWKEWEWGHDRTVRANGTTLETHWPKDSELRPAKALPKGEKERNSRVTTYRVVFQGEGHEPVTYEPASLEEFKRFAPGSTHTLRKEDDKVSVMTPEAPAPKAPEDPASTPKK